MAGRRIGNSLIANGTLDGALDYRLTEKVTAALVRLAVRVDPRRWEEPLPPQAVAKRFGIYVAKRMPFRPIQRPSAPHTAFDLAPNNDVVMPIGYFWPSAIW